jgi:hypothetical protein
MADAQAPVGQVVLAALKAAQPFVEAAAVREHGPSKINWEIHDCQMGSCAVLDQVNAAIAKAEGR